MAKIKTEKINYHGRDGAIFEFESDLGADIKDSTFSMSFPEELLETVKSILHNYKNKSIEVNYSWNNSKKKERKEYIVYSKNMEICRKILNEAVKEYMSFEEVKEIVILYKTNNNLKYVKQLDGSITPNNTYGSGGVWIDEDNLPWHAEDRYFSLGITVLVREKINYIGKTTSKTSYAELRNLDETNGEYLNKLNSFIGMKARNLENFKEITYTEKRAEFFYNLIISMCTFSDKLNNFLGDKEILLENIEKNKNLLSYN